MLLKLFKQIQKKKQFHYCLLLAIFLLAAYLRFAHLNWDQGLALHPDERNIAAAVSRLNWPEQTDPKFYAYNGFPLFLADISSQIITYTTNDPAWQTNWGKINLITRSYSALFSFLSVLFFYLIAKAVFKKKTSLIITFLATTTVTFIQHAHFGVTESLLLLQLLVLTWLSIKLIKEKRQIFSLAMAITLGLSIGTKTSALAYAIIPFFSILMAYRLKIKTLLKLISFFSISILVFYAVSPNTFNNFTSFWSTMDYEQAIVSGEQKVFYTMQFIDTIPYLFQLKTLLWLSSPFIVLLAAWGFYCLIKNRQQYLVLWPFFIFSFMYFLYVGSWYAKFNRYLILFIPALIILAGLALDRLKNIKLYKVLLALLLISNAWWALAFFKIYQTEHVRITASDWIEENIADQSLILHEERDERLPVRTTSGVTYQHSLLELYQNDNLEKINKLAEQLAEGDYLIIASRRLYRSIPRNTDYPHTNRYYKLLFEEDLGYQKIAHFNSYPNLFGIAINDQDGEETFRVFDHPSIMIFKNFDRLSVEKIFNRIVEN